MRIIIDFHSFPGSDTPASGNFLMDMLVEMARRHAEHLFIFLNNKNVKKLGGLPENASVYELNNYYSKWLGKQFWYKYFLLKELTRLRADLFVTVDNLYLRRTRVPACLLLAHGNELLQKGAPAGIKGRTDKMLVKAIQNASTVMTFSNYDQLKIQTYAPAIKLQSIMPQPANIPELKWPEKEMSKIDFAAGVEYFAFVGDLDENYDLIGLLKAFALFKKWQQSNMQMIIAGNRTSRTRELSEKLSSFKYRKEVNLLINPSKDKVQKIIGGAYAFVYPAPYDHMPVNILQAMQAGIPVISATNPVTKEWCENTVMYADTNDAEGFAKCMQLMYRDEKQRSDFISAAKDRLSLNEKNNMVENCLNFFEETIAK